MDKLKTELSLGLPGCSGTKSPDKKSGVTIFGKELEEGTNNGNTSSCCSGAKRVFSDSVGCQQSWLLSINGASFSSFSNGKDVALTTSSQLTSPTLSKAQVVGWPPIRSFRKNTMASSSSSKNNNESEEKSVSACLYVKVSMDGAPYLRKVDLQTYTNYMQLSSALEKMFGCFIKGQNGGHSHASRDDMIESNSSDYVRGSEYVLTYEDKDGDWMLVGDVPWKMFTENCRKLRITKGSEAIGLAPKCS